MTSPLTAARETVATALATVGVPVLAALPRTATPPCIVVAPGSPWIAPRGHVTLDVTCHAAAAAWPQLEDLVDQARTALWGAGLAPGDTNQPTETASTLSAATPVTLRTSCH